VEIMLHYVYCSHGYPQINKSDINERRRISKID
jgi:hypothetical protein